MTRLIVVLALVAAVVTGCGGGVGLADDGAVSAVAAVYPLAWLAERVAPEADVSLLTAGGAEAHDLDLTPRQRSGIERSDVVLYVGDIGYQPQVEEAVRSASGEVVSLSDVAGGRVLRAAEDAHGDEEGGEHGEEAVDAHMWFDPEIMADAAGRVGLAFAAADPAAAATYRENASKVRDELVALGGELKDLLGGPCPLNEVVVSHRAYGYLLRPFGHTQHGVTGINPEAGASSSKLGELIAEIKAQGIGHVVAEPVEGRKDAEAVAREAGVQVLEVSPLDAVTDNEAGTAFPELVRQQARQFATALGCP
ncbi:MAG: metal ABC transporter substrate-binding protein [Actinobacteria bacterium]|nr:metal ABC transporter substrate-binding protein [Actinomycetota bacterium]MBW3650526.1 metal ABC transporter substrate-binding protein [Actinomycetota bacterium]